VSSPLSGSCLNGLLCGTTCTACSSYMIWQDVSACSSICAQYSTCDFSFQLTMQSVEKPNTSTMMIAHTMCTRWGMARQSAAQIHAGR